MKAIQAHRPGASVIQADGHPAYVGVRGMRAIKGGTVLLTGAYCHVCTAHTHTHAREGAGP